MLTQRRRGVAVPVDARQYEAIQELLELLEDLYRADRQLPAGEGIDLKSLFQECLKLL